MKQKLCILGDEEDKQAWRKAKGMGFVYYGIPS
jgi:hypothetical protein